MTISSRIDAKRQLILSEATGVLTDDDVLKFTEAVWSSPGSAQCDKLMDLRGVETIEVTPECLRAAAARVPKAGPDQPLFRVAIVASTDLAYGLSRMYEMLRTGTAGEVRVFRRIDEARAWLGLTDG